MIEHIADHRNQLLQHPLYTTVDTIPKLRLFMADHVFAVWDFMSLLKRLQRDLTSTALPWRPPTEPQAARFINEIVLEEESDIGPNGEAASHLDIYLTAMTEIGADHQPFSRFMELLDQGRNPASALQAADVPDHTRRFVLETLEVAEFGSVEEVAAAFLFGREDIIPDMFARILPQWNQQAPWFKYYLERHIELDGDQHGPAGHRLLEQLVQNSDSRRQTAEQAAKRAIQSRIRLWDGIRARLESQTLSLV